MPAVIPVPVDPVAEERKKRQAEKRQALKELEILADQKVALSRHVFLEKTVPGIQFVK